MQDTAYSRCAVNEPCPMIPLNRINSGIGGCELYLEGNELTSSSFSGLPFNPPHGVCRSHNLHQRTLNVSLPSPKVHGGVPEEEAVIQSLHPINPIRYRLCCGLQSLWTSITPSFAAQTRCEKCWHDKFSGEGNPYRTGQGIGKKHNIVCCSNITYLHPTDHKSTYPWHMKQRGGQSDSPPTQPVGVDAVQ